MQTTSCSTSNNIVSCNAKHDVVSRTLEAMRVRDNTAMFNLNATFQASNNIDRSFWTRLGFHQNTCIKVLPPARPFHWCHESGIEDSLFQCQMFTPENTTIQRPTYPIAFNTVSFSMPSIVWMSCPRAEYKRRGQKMFYRIIQLKCLSPFFASSNIHTIK